MLTMIKNRHYVSDCRDLKNVHDLKHRQFDRGDIIPQTNHSLWLLKKGAVKTLTWNETGKTIILGYWGEGDIVGLPLSKVATYEVECLNTVEAICLPGEKCSYLFREITHCVRQTDELLRIVRTEKMSDRLSKLLVWLAQKFGSQVSQGIAIDLRLTHHELADLIGSTRVTVTRLLNQLDREKIIVRPCRFSIIIKDFDLLEKKIRN